MEHVNNIKGTNVFPPYFQGVFFSFNLFIRDPTDGVERRGRRMLHFGKTGAKSQSYEKGG